MKRFHFPLERVRRWREGQAALEEMKLEQLLGNLAGLRLERETIQIERARSQKELLEQPFVQAIELTSLDAYRMHAQIKIRNIENRELEVGAQVEQQRQRLIEKRREAELLQRLKRKSWDEWQAASDREQESLASELHLARLTRQRSRASLRT